MLPPPLPPSFPAPSQAATKVLAAAPPTPNRRSGRQYQQQQDISHLLGFTLPPRAPPPPSGPRRSAKRSPGHGVFDKQRYVHQFRFVVKPDKGYTQHLADPDVHFCWEDILQVIVSTTSSLSSASTSTIDQPVQRDDHRGAIPTCPICLSEPTAARMTKCGHVYCYACLLHYLALADGTKWRKCPVCWDAIYAKDLKAVKWHDPAAASSLIQVSPSSLPPSHEEPYDPFDTTLPTEPLKMRLVRRPQLTTLALPRSSTWPSEAVPPLRAPWEFTPDVINYAKFMLGSPEYLREALETDLRELEREVVELRSWGRVGGSDEELGIVFVRAAMIKVREQVEMVGGLRTPAVVGARKQALRELQEVHDAVGRNVIALELPVVSETSSSEVEEEVPTELLASRGGASLSSTAAPFTPGGSTNVPKSRPPRRNVNPPHSDADTAYLFYQAASGQNIFLQPLDIRILKSHFETYEALPDTIEVLVEGSDEGSMNEELRRRCRWLSHLPTACDVVFIEADLSRVVSKASLEPFAVALKQRRNKRRDKARREDKAKAKSEQKEADARPLYTTSTYSPSSYGIPLPSTFSASSFDEPHAFPPPSSRPPDVAPEHLTWNGSEATRTVWGTRSFATALHSSSRTLDSPDDPEFDERWLDFEDHMGGGRGGRGGGGSAGGSNAGGGRAVEQVPKGKKKKKGVTLNLTAGAGGRGA